MGFVMADWHPIGDQMFMGNCGEPGLATKSPSKTPLLAGHIQEVVGGGEAYLKRHQDKGFPSLGNHTLASLALG